MVPKAPLGKTVQHVRDWESPIFIGCDAVSQPFANRVLIQDVDALRPEDLHRGPMVVRGMAEDGAFSVLWFEHDLLLRRDLAEERQAQRLVRAIKCAHGTETVVDREDNVAPLINFVGGAQRT